MNYAVILLVLAYAFGAIAGCSRVKAVIRPPLILKSRDEAKDKLQKTEEPPTDWKEKGLSFAKGKDYPSAIDSFQKYVEQRPEEFFGYNALAVCYKQKGDLSSAAKNYDRALEMASSPEERAKALANIGSLNSYADKPQAALGFYKEAASEFEDNPFYLVLIARTFIQLEEDDRARKVLAQMEEKNLDMTKYETPEERGTGYYLAAKCYANLGEPDKVFHYLEAALKANPDRFIQRLEKEVDQGTSLLHTLKDDERLQKLLARYSDKMSIGAWLGKRGLFQKSGKDGDKGAK